MLTPKKLNTFFDCHRFNTFPVLKIAMNIFRVILFIGSVILFMGSVYGFTQEGLSTHALGGMVLFGLSSLLFLFEKKWEKFSSQLIESKRRSFHCEIKQDHFVFPKGYYFKHSSLGKSRQLYFKDINEIRQNTIPSCALINQNELIFLVGLTDEDLLPLASKIPFVKRQDNWGLICDEFLDTEYSEKQKQVTLNKLIESGISALEVKDIQKKIRFRMLVKTYFTWEWLYYGQWDVLKEMWPLTHKKYWWTMDVALRKKCN